MDFLYKYLFYALYIFIKVKDNEALRCYVCKDCTEVSDDYIQTCGTYLSTTTSVPSTTLIDDTTIRTTEEHEITTDQNEGVIVVTTPGNVAISTQNVITTVESIIGSTPQYPIETTSSSTENSVPTTEVTSEVTVENDAERTTQENTEKTTRETADGITEEITEKTTLETTERTIEQTTDTATEGTTKGILDVTTEETMHETVEPVTEETTEDITEEFTEGTTYETAETVTKEITEETTLKTTVNTAEAITVTEDTKETPVVTGEEEPVLISEARSLQEVSPSFGLENIRTRESLVNTQIMMANNLTRNRLQLPANSRKFRSAIFSFRSTLSRDTSDEVQPRCIVAYYTENDDTKIIRGCSFESDDANARCREIIGDGFDGDTSMSKCKLCDTDLCNSVSTPVVQLAVILICTLIVTSF